MRYLKVSAILLATVVAGCGGGGGDGGTPPVSAPAPAIVMADAFYSLVVGQVSTTSEDKEPVAIEAFALTAPEDSEPVTM